MPTQGPLPSMVTVVNRTAVSYGKSCDRFFMMTPSGEMMCRDDSGHIVATSTEELLTPTEARTRFFGTRQIFYRVLNYNEK